MAQNAAGADRGIQRVSAQAGKAAAIRGLRVLVVRRGAIGYTARKAKYRLERGMAVLVTRFTGALLVPLNEIPKYLNPDMRKLVETALEDAWRELTGGAPSSHAQEDFANTDPARRKMAGTIVALTSVGETDPAKLRRFALNAVKGLRKRR